MPDIMYREELAIPSSPELPVERKPSKRSSWWSISKKISFDSIATNATESIGNEEKTAKFQRAFGFSEGEKLLHCKLY
jgi:hypothetical protein